MSDNSPRAIRRRLQEGVLDEVCEVLNQAWRDAESVKDGHAIQTLGRVQDGITAIYDRLDDEFEKSTDTTEE